MSGFLTADRRQAVRQMVNPLDKCTIFSIYPKRIVEVKHTIEPGRFIIEAGSVKAPTRLVVGPSSWWRDVDETQPLLEIPQSSIIIANSVVRDYCNGLQDCDMSTRMPGLWYEQGDLKEPKAELKGLAQTRQNRWYEELIKTADILWSRTNQNPLAISDDAKLAAQELGLKEKPWLKDYNTLQLVNCPMCGHLRSPEYPMCPNCRYIVDEAMANKLGIRFAIPPSPQQPLENKK